MSAELSQNEIINNPNIYFFPFKRTVYIYETLNHMKMAENAGVRHVKVNRKSSPLDLYLLFNSRLKLQ